MMTKKNISKSTSFDKNHKHTLSMSFFINKNKNITAVRQPNFTDFEWQENELPAG